MNGRLTIGLLLLIGLAACQAPASSRVESAHPSDSPAASGSSVASGTIVFGRYVLATDAWLIFTIDPDGSNERQLVLPGSNGGPRWSPDGSKLMAYADNAQGLLFVGIANADGSEWTILDSPDPTLNLGCAAWSPDGQRLVCEGWDDADPSRTGLYTVRASDGADVTRLTSTPEGFHDIPIDYAPDGAQVLFGRDLVDGSAPGTSMVVNVDGTGLQGLPVHYGGGGQWNPDGTGILVGKAGSLFIVDSSGENPIPVGIEALDGYEFGYASEPSWSPEMRQIVFSYSTTDASLPDLFVISRDGSSLTQLTRTPDSEESADWTQ